jgi:hypothetical protein
MLGDKPSQMCIQIIAILTPMIGEKKAAVTRRSVHDLQDLLERGMKHLTEDTQTNLLHLPAEFGDMQNTLRQLIEKDGWIAQLKAGAQLKLLDLPAEQFGDKAGALRHLLRWELQNLKDDAQDKLLRRPEGDFDQPWLGTKAKTLQCLLKYGMNRLDDETQQKILDLPADQFEDKADALQYLLEKLQNLKDGAQNKLLQMPEGDVNSPSRGTKAQTLQVLLMNGMLEEETQKKILDMPAEQMS